MLMLKHKNLFVRCICLSACLLFLFAASASAATVYKNEVEAKDLVQGDVIAAGTTINAKKS